jgi:ArsR family transcriptional regulator, cadmium/lead-responsive transcriptional repressor
MNRQKSDVETAAALFRGFSEPTRLSILMELLGRELRVTDLVDRVGSSQANISGHLACLKDCGLVADRPEGRQVFYRLAGKDVVTVLRSAEKLLDGTGRSVQLCRTYGTKRAS